MLTSVEVYSQWPDAPTLPLDPNGSEETDLLQLINIDGINPVKATVNTSAFGSIDGVAYIGSDIPERNPVLTVRANPNWINWSHEDLRRLLYSYFMPKQNVKLRFYSDDMDPVEIDGIVEDCDISQFSSDLSYQISVICPDPHFTDINTTLISMETGDLAQILYNGSIECGMLIELDKVSGANPTQMQIKYGPNSEYLYTVSPLVLDGTSYFIMSSIPGNKYVENVNRSTGVVTSLLSKMQAGSVWPTLKPGKNSLTISVNATGEYAVSIAYNSRYGGL